MNFFNNTKNNVLLIIVLFIVAEIVACPKGDFALNDDWSYAWSVRKYIETGNILLGDWPAMTLVAHIIYGKLFCQIAGFSFVSLRISTLVLSFFAILLFYAIKWEKLFWFYVPGRFDPSCVNCWKVAILDFGSLSPLRLEKFKRITTGIL